jgi:hypothetical protein
MKPVRMFGLCKEVQETMDSGRTETLRPPGGTGSISSEVSSLRQWNACLVPMRTIVMASTASPRIIAKRVSFEQPPQNGGRCQWTSWFDPGCLGIIPVKCLIVWTVRHSTLFLYNMTCFTSIRIPVSIRPWKLGRLTRRVGIWSLPTTLFSLLLCCLATLQFISRCCH